MSYVFFMKVIVFLFALCLLPQSAFADATTFTGQDSKGSAVSLMFSEDEAVFVAGYNAKTCSKSWTNIAFFAQTKPFTFKNNSFAVKGRSKTVVSDPSGRDYVIRYRYEFSGTKTSKVAKGKIRLYDIVINKTAKCKSKSSTWSASL